MAPLALEDGRVACNPSGDEAHERLRCGLCGEIHPLDDTEYGATSPTGCSSTSTLSASWRALPMTV